jgi:hypothetical protein
MNKENLIKNISKRHITNVYSYRAKNEFLYWYDGFKLFGITIRKPGVYTKIWKEFQSDNKEDLYFKPCVDIHLSSGEVVKRTFNTLGEANEFKDYIVDIIRKYDNINYETNRDNTNKNNT